MTSPLISVDELRALDPQPALIDATWNLAGPPGREAYDAGHLPGAHFVDLDTELAAPPGPGRHPLPDEATVTALIRRTGATADGPVVVYDAANSLAAARAWWILRYYGLTDVRVLDGGLAAYRAAGGELTTAVPSVTPSTFTATPGHLPLVDAEGAAKVAATGVLLDARAPERFAGEVEPMDKIAGHIPGAVNTPMAALLTPDGHFKPAADLQHYFATHGVTPDTNIATYCGSGVTAAHTALALTTLGIQAPVYIGSWSDWITDPTRPIATGRD
ncbi:sulfurtransferase [Kribbella sandramycini]|uniref:Sulfurtransferase n=1 Tax=Kribbella sandramycini TaxID=60450 RepID=A0A7Y4KZP7_9ACTN|nr:thiosulfate/3-mercaptopyruvate sulfurtransferase [Kribbella sandramycini]NOL40826.1 sulfurtransferase [Kribbella sandramycini]